uniref:Uncharacterized protein n=1 Tax=Meloidogyne enterolobii TaxID=390850 RepID=A0A6V7VE28_MELEN|nr:unnamed protein product [Meloidogyne enterolobii]
MLLRICWSLLNLCLNILTNLRKMFSITLATNMEIVGQTEIWLGLLLQLGQPFILLFRQRWRKVLCD